MVKLPFFISFLLFSSNNSLNYSLFPFPWFSFPLSFCLSYLLIIRRPLLNILRCIVELLFVPSIYAFRIFSTNSSYKTKTRSSYTLQHIYLFLHFLKNRKGNVELLRFIWLITSLGVKVALLLLTVSKSKLVAAIGPFCLSLNVEF